MPGKMISERGKDTPVGIAPDQMNALSERAQWLESCIAALPGGGPTPNWKESVVQGQRRRDAEFAIAAAMQRLEGGRKAVTNSAELGTHIRMLGVRVSSRDGFATACRCWIEAARSRREALQ